jgi:predicted outer membrane protein
MSRLSLASLATASAAGLLVLSLGAQAQTTAPAGTAATNTATAAAASSTGTTATTATTNAAAAGEKLHGSDKAFIADGTQTVATQRDAARIANSRSSDREVKAFADQIVADYTKLSKAMRAASPRGVDVPRNDPDTAVLDSIKNLRGADFDKAYIEQVALGGQQKALSAFQAEIAQGRDAGLKKVATEGLPVIQADIAKAKELAQRKHMAS